MEPACRTQNSRVIQRFPANEVAGTFDASAISPPNGKLLTGILSCQADALDPRTRLTRVVVGMEWLHIWNEKKRFEIGDFEILSLAHSRRNRNDRTLARSSKLFSLAEAHYHRR